MAKLWEAIVSSQIYPIMTFWKCLAKINWKHLGLGLKCLLGWILPNALKPI